MRTTLWFALWVLGYHAALAAAQSPACASGPFEVDPDRIAQAIQAQRDRIPSPRVDPSLFRAADGQGIDLGFTWVEGGGLMSTGTGRWLAYDARRYLVYSGRFEDGRGRSANTLVGHPGFGRIVVGQVQPRLVSTIVVGRPAPVQARDIACLANALVGGRAEPAAAGADAKALNLVDVTARQIGACRQVFTDGHVEDFDMVGAVGAPATMEAVHDCDLERRRQQGLRDLIERVASAVRLAAGTAH